MFLECTKKLADTFKLPLTDITITCRQPLFEWHANIFTHNRRKGIIMMNNQTRYCVVLYGMTTKHIKQFRTIVLMAIEKTFLAEGLPEDVVAQYIADCGEVVFTNTHDRSVLSQLNDMLYLTSHWITDAQPANDLCMIELSKKLGQVPIGHLKYAFPFDCLSQALTNQ